MSHLILMGFQKTDLTNFFYKQSKKIILEIGSVKKSQVNLYLTQAKEIRGQFK